VTVRTPSKSVFSVNQAFLSQSTENPVLQRKLSLTARPRVSFNVMVVQQITSWTKTLIYTQSSISRRLWRNKISY